MKLYFAASVRGYGYYSDEYNAISAALKKLNYPLSGLSFNKDEVEHFYKQLEEGGTKAYSDFFNQTIETIKKSDVNIFECTMPSLGIGFQVEKSLEFNKPTIILYLKNHIPHFIAGTESDKIILKEYDKNSAAKVIESCVEDAKHLSDKRFNFFISPSLLTYLETASKKEGITKSTFIRNLILDHMRKANRK